MGSVFTIQALHPARNLSADPEKFQINPADQFTAARKARQNGRAIIGCYHSHPGGQPRPSAADLAGAGEDNFLWLIVAGQTLAAFLYHAGGFLGAALHQAETDKRDFQA